MKNIDIREMVMAALMTAVLCVLSPFSIPVGPVPISLTTLGLYLTIIILGGKKAAIVCSLYLLIGFIGIPVYSGFTGGPARLLGPTGGFLLGYLLLTVIAGLIVDKFPKKRTTCALGFVLGTCVCYIVGSLWLACQMQIGIWAAIVVGVVPFLIGDAVKIIIAIWFGPKICRRIGN